METITLLKILINLVNKYGVKLNRLKDQRLSRNQSIPNIWNDASVQYFKKKFEYKDSLRIKQWWIRKQGTLKKLIEKEISLKPKDIHVILFFIENAYIDCLIKFYLKLSKAIPFHAQTQTTFSEISKTLNQTLL